MKMKRLAVLMTMAIMVGSFSILSVGCAGMHNDQTHHVVSKKEHDATFPSGHPANSQKAFQCVYNEKDHVYFCPF